MQVLGEQTPQSDGIMRAERPRLDRFGPVGKACHVAQSLFVIGPACNRCSFSASSTDVPLARPLRTPRSRPAHVSTLLVSSSQRALDSSPSATLCLPCVFSGCSSLLLACFCPSADDSVPHSLRTDPSALSNAECVPHAAAPSSGLHLVMVSSLAHDYDARMLASCPPFNINIGGTAHTRVRSSFQSCWRSYQTDVLISYVHSSHAL